MEIRSHEPTLHRSEERETFERMLIGLLSEIFIALQKPSDMQGVNNVRTPAARHYPEGGIRKPREATTEDR